jgi:hypothetical protein
LLADFACSGFTVPSGFSPWNNVVVGSNSARVSTNYQEVIHTGTPAARVSAMYEEVIHLGSPQARVSAAYYEVIRSVA